MEVLENLPDAMQGWGKMLVNRMVVPGMTNPDNLGRVSAHRGTKGPSPFKGLGPFNVMKNLAQGRAGALPGSYQQELALLLEHER